MTKSSHMPQPRIEVFQYFGYNGGFARDRQLLWKCELVGADGRRKNADPNSWHGYMDRKYADRLAEDCEKFTGWPVVQLGRQKGRDDTPHDVLLAKLNR